jgi:hypothetical protein
MPATAGAAAAAAAVLARIDMQPDPEVREELDAASRAPAIAR